MKLFDLHCDTILECETQKLSLYENSLHLDLKRMQAAEGMAQCFAIFIHQKQCQEKGISPYWRYRQVYAYFQQEMQKNADVVKHCLTWQELEECRRTGKIAAILTVEGGEAIEGSLEKLEQLYQDGVRLMTLTWNYENEIGYPHTDKGGLKPFGFEVVERMNGLHMLIDVSHLSDQGFRDVLAHSKAPIVASHSCARALCVHSRNLSDDMLRLLGRHGGVVGVNFYKSFLRHQGTGALIDDIVIHAKHIADVAGIDAVALGSDHDGISGPLEWHDYAGMQQVVDRLGKVFRTEELEKICYGNACRIFREL